VKRLVSTVIVAILVVSVLTVPLLFVHFLPQPVSSRYPRQVDPSTAQSESVYGPGLFLFYGAIIDSVVAGNLTAAESLLGQTGLIHIPPDITYDVSTFNDLINSTANLLSTINTQLQAANASLSKGREGEAAAYLNDALKDLSEVNVTLTELLTAAPRLAQLTGMPSSLFLQKLDSIQALYAGYGSEAMYLHNQILALNGLLSTSISLTVPSVAIETGSDLQVTGTLTSSGGSPLPSRTVTIYFQGESIGNATTNSLGVFSATLRTPFVYEDNVSLFASYLPQGNDSLIYAPSSSSIINLTVLYEKPSVRVNAPQEVLAGLSIMVDGTLLADGSALAGYVIYLDSFGSELTDVTSSEGNFSFQVVAPAGVGPGPYSFTLRTSGNRTVAPLIASFQVNVIKLDPSVTFSAPQILIAGIGAKIQGSAEANGTPLSGAAVLNISPGISLNTTTSVNGSFDFSISPPLTSPIGQLGYTIGLYPNQSWVSPTEATVRVFVFNPLALVLPIISAILLLFLFSRFRRASSQQTSAVKAGREPAAEIHPQKDNRTGVSSAYFAAVRLVEGATSVRLRPGQTIREYLAEVKDRLRGFEHFKYISFAQEKHLYGPGVSKDIEERVEIELSSLRGELR
jgi:hypothetical protein